MARDKLHDVVRTALEKDGWTITDDPLRLVFGADTMLVDLAAERASLLQSVTKSLSQWKLKVMMNLPQSMAFTV
jgi:hypothetical protein